MSRKSVGLVFDVSMVFVLLVAVFGVVLNVPLVWGSGTIYIRADGSIDPPTAPISTLDNVTYTFTGNIYDSIVVERDDIIVDGADCTVQGTGSATGIDLWGRNNVTLKNAKVQNFERGVYLGYSLGLYPAYCIISNNVIRNNVDGITVDGTYGTREVVIEKNDISGNSERGILLIGKSNVIIRENTIELNKLGIATDSSAIHSGISIVGNEILSNQEYGIYLYSASYLSFWDTGAAYLYDVSISANNVSSNGDDGIFVGSYGTACHGNFFGYSGFGYTYNVTVSSNIISNNIGNGVYLYSCGIGCYGPGYGYIYNVNASHNTVSNNHENGLYLYSARYQYSYIYDVTASSNSFSSNGQNGVYAEANSHFEQSVFDFEILENNVSANAQKGVCIEGGLNSRIAGNSISCNMYGVHYSETQNNKADSNNVFGNYYGMNVTYGATVDAEYNYWGDISGPYHETSNPNGKGDSVNGDGINLDFIPFLTSSVAGAPPKAKFNYIPERAVLDGIVSFDASASYDRDGLIISYMWDFGDGNVTTVVDHVITHVYSALGNYTVTLRVTDNNGAGDDAAKSVTVKKGCIITLLANPATVQIGSSVTLNGTITPTEVDVNVTISCRVSDGVWKTLNTVKTDSNSYYSYIWNTTYVSTHEIKSSWLGDLDTWGAESDVKAVDVQGEPKTWIVDDDGLADFHTIQEAINASRHPKDTIYVRNGIYYESIVVDKTLTLIGENYSATIIDGGGMWNVVVVQKANNVKISRFTIQNSGPYNYPNSGLYILSSNDTVISENMISNNAYPVYIESSNHTRMEKNIIASNHDRITIKNSRENVILGNELKKCGGFMLGKSSGNILSRNNISDTYMFVWLIDSNDNIVSNNNVKKTSSSGIMLTSSSNNIVSSNYIQQSPYETWWSYAIELRLSNNNLLFGNNLTYCQNGMFLDSSTNNLISGNRIADVKYEVGIGIRSSSNNKIYHNSFIRSKYARSYNSRNAWDDGYPSGGNYWSDYTGVDEKSGSNQDQTGPDGIGDTAYVVDAKNQDKYPLMKPYVPDSTSPTTFDDYDGLWHVTDFTINLIAKDSIPGSGVDQTYYKINDGSTKTLSIDGQPLITTPSANNKLEYWSKDKAVNEELPHKTLTGIKLDKTTPMGSITINSGVTYTTSRSVTLTLTATDATSGVYEVRYGNDGVWDTEAWETPSSTKTWILTSEDGTKTVYYQVKDNAGLISTTYTDTVILDTKPPSGSITINDGTSYTTTITGKLTLTATDATSGIAEMRFSNDNTTYTEWQNYAISLSWNLQDGDGAKTVYVQFRDNAGLISTYSNTITLDTTPPTGFITVAEDAAYTNSPSTTLTLSATDATSGLAQMRFSNDNVVWSDWESYTTSKSWTLLTGDGLKGVTVQYKDNAGLVSSYSDSITLDTKKPTASAGMYQTRPTIVNEDTPVTFDGSASTDENGIANYTWIFIDVTTKTLAGPKPTYFFNTPGVYTVTLNLTDIAGNWATDTVLITVLDITNPVANAGQDQTVNAGANVTFDAEGSNDNVGITSYEWDFGDGTIGTGKTTTHTYADPAIYTVKLTVKDTANNTATHSISVTVLPTETPPPPTEPFSIWIVGVIIVIIGVAVGSILFVRRRK